MAGDDRRCGSGRGLSGAVIVNRRVDGLRTWIWQRVSALYLALFVIYFISSIVLRAPLSWQEWHDWIGAPVTSTLIIIFFAMVLLHAWVGVRDVVLDYIHPLALRILVLMSLGGGLLVCGIWVARIMSRAWAQ